jgi:hypothetical protein
MEIGDPVIMRSVLRGNVCYAIPHRFAGMWGEQFALFCQQGNRLKGVMRKADGSYLEEWVAGATPTDGVWERGPVLRFVRPGERHGIEVLWDPDWGQQGWYVNLQAPLVRRGAFFDTLDQALDIRVQPDGTWEWKDEDDFAEAIALGMFDRAEAELVRAEGERVIAARPWPTGWEEWRPPDHWEPLAMPPDWDESPE